MDKVELAFDAEKRSSLLNAFLKSKFAIGLMLAIVAILIWNIYRSSEVVLENETILGVIVGVHQTQTKVAPSVSVLSVKLITGEVITVSAPKGTPIKMDSEIEILRGKTNHGNEFYYFGSYKNSNER